MTRPRRSVGVRAPTAERTSTIASSGSGFAAGLLVLSACGSDGNDEGPADDAVTTDAPADDMADEPGTIVDVAVANGSFETLVAAVTAADLVDCLLLEYNVDALSAILTYHVVSGEVLSTDLADGPVPTVQGEEVTVDLTDGVVLNDSANGVIVPPSIDVAAFLETCPA